MELIIEGNKYYASQTVMTNILDDIQSNHFSSKTLHLEYIRERYHFTWASLEKKIGWK